MWQISNFLMSKGAKQSIMQAIKKNLGIEDPAMMKGVERSMTKSFEKMRDQAIHVDLPKEQTIDENGNKISLMSFNI